MAAEVPAVPAVQISRVQWEKIQFMIAELAEIADGVHGKFESCLIQGEAISQSAMYAQELKHLVGE